MFLKSVKVSILLVYLVIVAGAVVRMTGSGMGCPDWPKCFGYFIPPTEISELEFQPERFYKKGQVIIVEESLQVAKSDFTTTENFDKNNWDTYTKHDYAVFNPAHTWVEYINRLFGALAGFGVFIMALLSFKKWKTNKSITLLSWLSVFFMGFQAWLGATVVYSVLSPIKITIHMVMALVIVALLLYIHFLAADKKTTHSKTKLFQNVLIFAAVLTLIQVILGTQVRQFVDEQVKVLGDDATSLWMAHPEWDFYIHRSFSILVVAVNAFLWWLNRKKQFGFTLMNWVMLFLILEIITGIAMYNFDFPFGSQTIHLVVASLL
ncbi:MAG TPA: COX15/CtaA family protein, partial [Flavobacteriaceae bacterium]|nr:COX15/CtaA family protein [Flavobacteriaceae bacterium]